MGPPGASFAAASLYTKETAFSLLQKRLDVLETVKLHFRAVVEGFPADRHQIFENRHAEVLINIPGELFLRVSRLQAEGDLDVFSDNGATKSSECQYGAA